MEYKDNDFGNLIKSIRNKNKINAETLVRGICSVKVLNNIESGKTFPGYLLRNFLIDRLGLAREWFENMLTVGEYEEWQCRRRIISQLRKKEYMSADALVEEYRKKYIAVFMTLLCVITMCPQIVYAADEVPQRETVRVGFFEMNGYHMQDEDGNRSGYGYDTLRLMARYWN